MRGTLYLIASLGGLSVALLGIAEQAAYLWFAVRDYASTRDRDVTYQFMALSRIITSVTLGLVHILVVTSIAVILPVRPADPSPLAFQLILIRGVISLLVIIGTTVNFMARSRARAFVQRRQRRGE